MKKALLVLMALFAAGLWADEQAVKVFTVKPPNAERIQRTLKMVVGDGNVVFDPASATLVVRTNPTMMQAVEQVVKELDAGSSAPKNIELTFYILEATKEPAADSAPLPPELQPAIAQIKSAFAYQGFRLLDTAYVRTRTGDWVELKGQAQEPIGTPSSYQLKLRPYVSSEGRPVTIRMDGLHFHEYLKGGNLISFDSNVDLKEGQQAVIGKTGIEGSRSALILVATGKVVD